MHKSNPGISSRNLILLNIALSLVFMVAQTFLLQWFGISPNNAIIDSVISNILLAIICYYLGNILRYYRPGNSKHLYIFIWDLAISGFGYCLQTGYFLHSLKTQLIWFSYPNHYQSGFLSHFLLPGGML